MKKLTTLKIFSVGLAAAAAFISMELQKREINDKVNKAIEERDAESPASPTK